MNIKANLSSRHIFWWVYSLYPLLVFTWGSYAMIVSGSYPPLKWLSICLDAIAIFCLYCFLRQKPSFTRGFWILFAIIYIIKSVIGFAILASVAFNAAWDGSSFSHVVLMDIVVAILDVPFIIAVILYSFGSKQIWAICRSEMANA